MTLVVRGSAVERADLLRVAAVAWRFIRRYVDPRC